MPTRRAFLKDGALAMLGTAIVPGFVPDMSAMQMLDLHAHFAMHMRLPTTPRDNPAGDAVRVAEAEVGRITSAAWSPARRRSR